MLNGISKDVPEYRISYHNYDFEFGTKVGEEGIALQYISNLKDKNEILLNKIFINMTLLSV